MYRLQKVQRLKNRDLYPLPKMVEYIDPFGVAYLFSTLDTNGTYYQMEADESHNDKTAFASHHGF